MRPCRTGRRGSGIRKHFLHHGGGLPSGYAGQGDHSPLLSCLRNLHPLSPLGHVRCVARTFTLARPVARATEPRSLFVSTASPNPDRNTQGDAWKAELKHKLAAARARHRAGERTSAPAEAAPAAQTRGRSSVAAAVAARYAGVPTYSELLAREAQLAAETAERAALEARAAAEAVRAELDAVRQQEFASTAQRTRESSQPEPLAVRLDVDARTQQRIEEYEASRWERPSDPPEPVFRPALPSLADPLEEVLVSPITPLAANLVEFPRELVAPRKLRPRLAEGPLRDSEEGGADSQLRIFEAGPEEPFVQRAALTHPTPSATQVQGTAALQSAPAGWSLRVDTPALLAEQRAVVDESRPALKPASLEDRCMAMAVDGALVLAGFFLFVLGFCTVAPRVPFGGPALVAGAAALLAIFAVYQLLFFTYAESTPGMRYARIAFCTFDDENPTRPAMRRRIGALLLAALPAGLGLLWSLFDEEALGWHDRISGIYQRKY
jgi:uncharacterized RDD family membrane protein YckC